jgi:Zn-dependent protease with chaperone function
MLRTTLGKGRSLAMKKTCLTIIACLLAITAIIPPVVAQDHLQQEPPGRDPAFEQEIYDRLAAINADAVPIFQEATQAMDAGDLVAAKQGYELVLDLAPDFPDAARRLSYVELGLGNIQVAVQCARQAYAVQDSPYNRNALARALLATEDPRNAAEALTLARAAAEALPDDVDINLTLLYAGLVRNDIDAIRQASTTLVEVVPEFPLGHFFVGLVAAQDGKWEQAERELLLAQELGMPAEDVQAALDDGIASQARLHRWLRRGAYTIVIWLAGLAVLFLVGILLSRLTLAAVHRAQPAAQFKVGRAEQFVRTLYRIVIAATSLYFYVSVPLLILIVVAGTAGIFYLFLAAGSIPLRLAFVLGMPALYTLFVVVRSVFIRVEEKEPGRPVSRDEAPLLWSLAEEVAERVGTRIVDAIYITPAPEIAVTERGSLLKNLRGVGQRCLILGLGVLPGMTKGQFKAILAHEYGHFSNRDMAGGNLARQVRLSMHQMAYGLAVTGQARWYNPAWLFVNGFNRIFLRITLGASRLQEVLADRYAAVAYGVRNFVDGLTHIVRQNLAFNMQVAYEMKEATGQGRSLQNLYILPSLQSDSLRENLETKVSEVMSRPTSPYDSHPAVRERIKLLQQLEVANEVKEGQEPVWDLLPGAEKLQSEMTAIIQANVRQRRLHAAQVAHQDVEPVDQAGTGDGHPG